MNYLNSVQIDEILDHQEEIDYDIAHAVEIYETETELDLFKASPEVQVDLFEVKL